MNSIKAKGSSSKKNLLWLLGFFFISGIFFSGLLAWSFYQAEQKTIIKTFTRDANDKLASLQQSLVHNFEHLYSLQSSLIINAKLSHQEFNTFTNGLLKRSTSIQALEWIPRVAHSQRAQYERLAQQSYAGFEFTQQAGLGKMTRREPSDYYYPVYYLNPLAGNELALGYDLGSNEQRLTTLNQAAELGQLVLSERIELVQESQQHQAVFAVMPIYAGSATTVERRMAQLRGYVLAVFRLDKLIEPVLDEAHAIGLELQLWDVTRPPSELIYQFKPQTFRHDDSSGRLDSNRIQHELTVGGRKWLLQVVPSQQYMDARASIAPYLIFLICSGLIVWISIFNRSAVTRAEVIAKLVDERTFELRLAHQNMAQLAATDGLTGLSNRRRLDVVLKTEWSRGLRENSSVTMLMIDIDYFKQYNDGYGHLAGDDCLIAVARALELCCKRATDFLARYGGEEFAIILLNTEHPEQVAERCRSAVEALYIPHEYSITSKFLTVSVGVSSLTPTHEDHLADLITMVDKALSLAKIKGRNQISVQLDLTTLPPNVS